MRLCGCGVDYVGVDCVGVDSQRSVGVDPQQIVAGDACTPKLWVCIWSLIVITDPVLSYMHPTEV